MSATPEQRIAINRRYRISKKGKAASAKYVASKKGKDNMEKWVKNHPYQKEFDRHRFGAASRGIAFLFTLEEWLAAWGNKIEFRGRGAEGLCMGRIGDTGPYMVNNVEIITNSQNMRDCHKRKRERV